MKFTLTLYNKILCKVFTFTDMKPCQFIAKKIRIIIIVMTFTPLVYFIFTFFGEGGILPNFILGIDGC